MNMPNTPSLLLLAAFPGALACALGALMLARGWARALGATLVSVGLALSALVLVVVASLGFSTFSGMAESPYLLLGIPLGMFGVSLGVLLRRADTTPVVWVACALTGLAVLYGLGGFVLMMSACGFHSGGC